MKGKCIKLKIVKAHDDLYSEDHHALFLKIQELIERLIGL